MPHDLLVQFPLEFCRELGTYLFLREHCLRDDPELAYRELKGAISTAVLPERATVLRNVRSTATTEVVAIVDDVLLSLSCSRSGGWVWASGASQAVVVALLDELSQRSAREPRPRQVDVSFVDLHSTRSVSLDARPWSEVSPLYPLEVRTALDDLTTHTGSAEEARRLMLWHGAPGTGKTTAIRALLLAWRDWADGVVVTDPEALLADGRYLRRVVLDADDEDDRWLVLVLEDAESLLHKTTGSKGLSKLLNLGDGLLGQGLRCLFLITTNEPLQAVHPALVRPGRCLANVEFGPLPAQQAAGILGRPVERDMTLAEVMTARPLSVVQEPVAVGQYL